MVHVPRFSSNYFVDIVTVLWFIHQFIISILCSNLFIYNFNYINFDFWSVSIIIPNFYLTFSCSNLWVILFYFIFTSHVYSEITCYANYHCSIFSLTYYNLQSKNFSNCYRFSIRFCRKSFNDLYYNSGLPLKFPKNLCRKTKKQGKKSQHSHYS